MKDIAEEKAGQPEPAAPKAATQRRRAKPAGEQPARKSGTAASPRGSRGRPPPGPAEVSVSGAELLERIERQAADLGRAEARLAELERELAAQRETSTELARALEDERDRRNTLEATSKEATDERDGLVADLALERKALTELDEELRAANLQAATLEERMKMVWAEMKEGEAEVERGGRRGLRRRARGSS